MITASPSSSRLRPRQRGRIRTLTALLCTLLPSTVSATEVQLANIDLYGGVTFGSEHLDFGGDVFSRGLALHRREVFEREESNGVVRPQNVGWGDSWIHHLSADEIFGEEDEGRGDGKMVHLTFNTCLQPISNVTTEEGTPPQLQVYVSNSTQNKAPGPDVDGKVQYVVPVDGGFGSTDVLATGDLWVGVYASALSREDRRIWTNNSPWNYELALSTEAPYHGFFEDQFLYLVDTDDTTALLITGNMTDHASEDGGVDEDPRRLTESSYTPYTMYAQNRNTTSRFRALEKSYCAVRQLAQIRPANTDVSMTTRGLGNLPKQQFHLKELNRSSEYWGYLARPRNRSTTDTSGMLWQPVRLDTKSDGNCQIIYNLPFCSEVAYAVPSNPTVFGEAVKLMEFYDNLAAKWWQNFTYSLQQIQCNASSNAAYSLIRNCDDCAAAYKNWLCAVTIPRCMDYSSDLPYLAERSSNKLFWNGTANGWQKHPRTPVLSQSEIRNWRDSGGWLANKNSTMSKVPSRNTKIDEIVKPGAYKEVRPCKDLCWTLVQSCPSPLGFSCPADKTLGKEMSYGERSSDGDVTCSYLGAVYALSDAPVAKERTIWWAVTAAVASVVWLVG